MCGIAGAVDLGRGIDDRGRAAVAAMVATLERRGPDGQGCWVDEQAALGHRRLAVLDPAGGAQPMALAADGLLRTGATAPGEAGDDLVLVHSGEIENFAELRDELRARGHRFVTGTDTEVLLAGWRAWGEGVVERLEGMFAFAVWDARRRELFLVRDRMGVKPLYWWPTPDGVLFGSEPKAILAHPDTEAVVDLDGLREILAFVRTPGHGVYRGMHEVRPGSWVRVSRDGVAVRRYWRLEAREHTDDVATTVARVGERLEEVVARELVADVPLCTLLSGGLDSSVVTALAARGRRARGEGPIRSFSVDVAPGGAFAADAVRGSADEPFARMLARHVGADHETVTLTRDDLLSPAARAAVLAARDLPVSIGDLDVSLHGLLRAVRGRSTVALSGECADELFGGYHWFHDPAAVGAGVFGWHTAHHAPRPSTTMLWSPDLLRRLDLPAFVDAAHRTSLAEVPHLDDSAQRRTVRRFGGDVATERRMREIGHQNLVRFAPVMLDRKDRVSMASGLEVRVPFCDHRLVEYVFNTPWTLKTVDGREKSLLRLAARELLPDAVAGRVKSPYPSTQDPGYEAALRRRLADVLADPDAPVRPLLDPDRVRRVLDAPLGAVSAELDRRRTENVLQVDAWLRTHRPHLVW